jgi:hypothetical protein
VQGVYERSAGVVGASLFPCPPSRARRCTEADWFLRLSQRRNDGGL